MKNLPAIWSKSINRFLDPIKDDEVAISNTGDIYVISHNSSVISGYDVEVDHDDTYLFFDNTRLKDINSKSIYSESSIFEFEAIVNGFRQQPTTHVLKGSFEFNLDDLRYEINIYNSPLFKCLWYDSQYMSNFKIVDTIQENKLGLIKESL